MVLKDALFVVVGVIAGILSGAFGVGGAVISTPLIRALGVSPLFAVASTLPAILPSAITGSIRYQREKLINWQVVLATTPVGIVAAVAGAYFAPKVPGRGHVQMIVTACLLGYVAYRMRKDVEPKADHETFGGKKAPFLLGIGAGTLSGLLGVGGGIVTFPGFREWLRMPLRSAIATSLVCVGIFAVPSTITHAVAHHISWRVAIELAVGVVPGATFGSHYSLQTHETRLKNIVAIVLAVIAVVYGILETRALIVG